MEDVTEEIRAQQQPAQTNGTSEASDEIARNQAASNMLRPREDARFWKLVGLDGSGQVINRTYTQEVLSYFGKQDLYTLLTDFFDKFISGEFGIKVKDLWESDLRKNMGQITTEASPEQAQRLIDENLEMIKAVFRIVQRLPGLQQEIFVLALGVPENEQDWAKKTMAAPLSRGGLDDDTAFEILKTFVSQNAQPIKDFFSEKGMDFLDHARREILGEASETSEETEPPTTEGPDPDTPGGTLSSITAPSQGETL